MTNQVSSSPIVSDHSSYGTKTQTTVLNAAAGHHRFRLVNVKNARILENTLEIHLLELPRYSVHESKIDTTSTLN